MQCNKCSKSFRVGTFSRKPQSAGPVKGRCARTVVFLSTALVPTLAAARILVALFIVRAAISVTIIHAEACEALQTCGLPCFENCTCGDQSQWRKRAKTR